MASPCRCVHGGLAHTSGRAYRHGSHLDSAFQITEFSRDVSDLIPMAKRAEQIPLSPSDHTGSKVAQAAAMRAMTVIKTMTETEKALALGQALLCILPMPIQYWLLDVQGISTRWAILSHFASKRELHTTKQFAQGRTESPREAMAEPGSNPRQLASKIHTLLLRACFPLEAGEGSRSDS